MTVQAMQLLTLPSDRIRPEADEPSRRQAIAILALGAAGLGAAAGLASAATPRPAWLDIGRSPGPAAPPTPFVLAL